MNAARLAFAKVAFLTLATLVVLLLPGPARAAEFWVAPTGSDSAAGTSQAAAFATVGRAQTAASAGDTVWIKGGNYTFSGSGTVGVRFSKSGSANNLIKYFAVAGEIPVFDLTNLTPTNRVTGLDVNCSYVHIRGLEVKGVRQYMSGQDSWGVRIQGNNNILENLNVHHNEAPGIFITSGANNLVLNCDSHHNYDVLENGGSGDGFGCHSSGNGNVLRGCRGYDNSDDGYDFINAFGSCTVEKSFSFRNGWRPDTTTPAGNGAGFKSGGYGNPPALDGKAPATHTVQQCVAFNNKNQGFYANHHPGTINFYNNTSFGNATNFDMTGKTSGSYMPNDIVRNNVSLSPGTAFANLSGGSATFNSWNLSVTVTAADFLSTAVAEALAPRQADGSLPNVNFMRLATGSDLIDKGTDVGLPFSGSAPDLGAFESGLSGGGGTSTGGAGGAGTTGGGTNGGSVNGGSANGGGGASSGGRTASNGGTGTAGSGGTPGSGGRAGSSGGGGGVPGASGGPSTTSGGAVAQGGATAAQGGAVSSFGGSATTSGGAPSGTSGGSSSSNGGTTTSGGSGPSAGSAGGPGISDPAGCGCRLAESSSRNGGTAATALLGLALAFALRRRLRDA